MGFLTSGQAAQRLGVTPDTVVMLVYRWPGRDNVFPLLGNGRRLIPVDRLDDLATALNRRRSRSRGPTA